MFCVRYDAYHLYYLLPQHRVRPAVVQWSKVNFHRVLSLSLSSLKGVLFYDFRRSIGLNGEHTSKNVKNVEKRKLNFGVVTSASVSGE